MSDAISEAGLGTKGFAVRLEVAGPPLCLLAKELLLIPFPQDLLAKLPQRGQVFPANQLN